MATLGHAFIRAFSTAFALASVQADDAFFSAKIEPLLKQRCYECHSHEAKKMKGGLTLDSRSGWAEGGDSGAAIVPGKVDESLLVRMVRWADDDHQMPPKEKLPAAEIALLEEWVKQGAPDPRATPKKADADWWSLRPLVRPTTENSIDAFIRATLKAKGLAPSPPADRRTLLRRLSYDLHGLPPSPEQVDSFVSGAVTYEALVDQMLASPRYGERWARHWMDTIHFADSHGFEHDVMRPNAWRYRDYLIDALNSDTPWDRFIREQLAADVFFPAETKRIAALGFLGAGTYDISAAGTAPKSFEYLDRDDLVTQTMAAFVSTTANCARCHAHKFDPISQEDYFALQAVFAGIGKGDIAYDEDAAIAQKRQRWTTLLDAANRRDAAILLAAENQAIVAEWEKERGPGPQWKPLAPEIFTSTEGTTLERLADGSILSSGTRPDTDTYTITTAPQPGLLTALRVDLLPHDSLPLKGPGRTDNGNVHISEFELRVFRPGSAKPEKLAIRRATSDFDQVGYDITKAIDGDLKTSWAIHPNVGVAHHAVLELTAPPTLEAGARLVVGMRQLQPGHIIGRFLISATNAGKAAALPAVAEAALAKAERTDDDKTNIAAAFFRIRAADELAALPAQAKVWAAGKTAVNERGSITIAEPRKIHILRRGDLDKPGAEIAPGALTVRFANTPAEAPRRAALADWIAAPHNLLTWRSVVNRVWHYHFGKGLCDTPSDFGRMGSAPTHSELLDWLAVWFRDDAKGSLKALHRLIVTSETYRQSSAQNTALDPDNRFLSRMNRTRLDADQIRDSIFAASGALDLTMGGPGIQHFTQRPGPQATPVLDYTAFDWNSPGAARRSIYRIVWRGIADPFMESIDFPDMGMLSPVRGFSASPLQSLALFNNDLVHHHSAKFAARIDNANAAFRIALQRTPTPEEAADFTALADKHGLATACRVLFNTNEFLFLD